jgi:hypothetical protein
MSSGIILGNVQAIGVASVTLSPALIVLNTTAEQTFTVPGILATDVIVGVSKPTTQAGLGIVNMRVTAANTVGITFSNNTGSSITPTASQVYLITYVRPESVQTGVAGV